MDYTDPRHTVNVNQMYVDVLIGLNHQIDADPRNTQPLFEKGLILKELQLYEWAEVIFDLIDEINPNHGYALLHKAYCLTNLGRYDEALASLDKAAKLNYRALREDVEDYRNRLLEYLDRNHWQFGRKPISTPIKEAVTGLTYKGLAFFVRQKYKDAIECYSKSLRLDKNSFFTLYFMGDAMSMLKKFEESVVFYDEAFSLDSGEFRTLFYKAIVLTMLDRYEDAIKTYEKLLEIKPGDVPALLSIGDLFFKIKKYDRAIESYEKVSIIESDDVRGLFSIGNLFFAIKEYDKAITNYERILILESHNSEAKICIEIAKAMRDNRAVPYFR